MSDSLVDKSYVLNTGAVIPALGFGTGGLSHDDAYNSVREALKRGYRLIDTAYAYGNEEAVGRALRDSGIPRSDIFVTTKLPSRREKSTQEYFEESLKKLGLDYVDLYLIHWPVFTDSSGKLDQSKTIAEVWNELQLLERSKVKAIGVSNFDIKNLQLILDSPTTTIVPAVNQVEIHLQNSQNKLVDFVKSKGILLEAYSPLGHGSTLELKSHALLEIAEKHHSSPASIALNWGVARGYVVISRSKTPGRIRQNARYVRLDQSDLLRLRDLSSGTPKRIFDHGKTLGVDIFRDDNN